MSLLLITSSTIPTITNLPRTTGTVIALPPDPLLPSPVASHPDMLLFVLGDTLVTYRTYYAIAQPQIDRILTVTGRQLLLTDHPHGNVYPTDVGLNALVCGRYLIGRLDVLAPEILELATAKGLTPVSVRQGYAGCSGLFLGDVLLSADPSMTQAAESCGISVVSIPDRDILLPGYDHGFIGGCGGVWQDTIFLCGTPTPAQQKYFDHPLLRGKKFQYLYKGPLFDCGGIKCFQFSKGDKYV